MALQLGLNVKRGLFLIAAVAVCGKAERVPPPQDPQATIGQSLQAMESDWKQAPHYSFIERDVESKGRATAIIKSYEVLMLDGSPYNRLIRMQDAPFWREQQIAEDRKLQSEIKKREQESESDRRKRLAAYIPPQAPGRLHKEAR